MTTTSSPRATQPVDDVRADEARPAGDKSPHRTGQSRHGRSMAGGGASRAS